MHLALLSGAQHSRKTTRMAFDRIGAWPDAPYHDLWRLNLGASVICVAATPTASLIAAACIDRRVVLLSSTGEVQWTRMLDGEAWAVAMSADGSRVAVGVANKNPASGKVFTFDRNGIECWQVTLDAPVWSVALSDDGAHLAVGCWDNCVYRFEETFESYRQCARVKLGDAGVYGVAMSGDGEYVLAAAYDRAVTMFDRAMQPVTQYPCRTGTYRTALSRDCNWGIVGLRDGRAMMFRAADRDSLRYTEVLSQRPICGAAISRGGVAALGSFDGRAFVVNAEGRLLWSLYADGEVWSTTVSQDGSVVAIGTGDGAIRVVRNRVDDAAADEIRTAETAVESRPGDVVVSATAAIQAFRKYGLVDYAVRRLKDWAPVIGREIADDLALQLLLEDTAAFPGHRHSHFQLASLYHGQGAWRKAASHYINAGQDSRIRLESLTKAGEAFAKAGLEFAAKSSFRQAREQQITEEAKRTLYSIGRAYEDNGKLAEARKYYEVVFTFTPDYRDVFARLERLSDDAASPDTPSQPAMPLDWNDSLLSGLLGPDVPRVADIDPSLGYILQARSKELAITAEDRRGIMGAVAAHAFAGHEGRRYAGIDYDVAAYMRYDASVPEDEAKKSLELVHVLDAVKRYGPVKRSLDIGTATGRYPTILAGMGIQASGIDREPEAINYARKKTAGATNPDFSVGDARALPFQDGTFDLITCMMGTAAHFPTGTLDTVLGEMYRCLKRGGVAIISTWDIDCPHLTFLSIYSHAQKEEMRRNSLPREQMRELAGEKGFVVDEMRPVGLMPEALAYELDLHPLDPSKIGHLVDVELAFRALFPAQHGQMFMMLARKPHTAGRPDS